jgi:glutaredoxin
MENAIYSATGCARCKITKNYLKENKIPFTEFDFKAEGKEAFAQFYRSNRSQIFRDKDGVEFPVYDDGKQIKQGVSVILGYLIAGDQLTGFIGRNQLHGEWIDGFNISAGDPERVDDLITVLQHLKKNNLKIQATCSGANPAVLETLLNQGLVDKLLMEVRGPAALYGQLTGTPLEADALAKSIELAMQFPEFEIFTTIAPLKRNDGTIDFLTAEEVGMTAEAIKTASGNNKIPYLLKSFQPSAETAEDLKSLEPLAPAAMFKYRTQARRFLVMSEIEK